MTIRESLVHQYSHQAPRSTRPLSSQLIGAHISRQSARPSLLLARPEHLRLVQGKNENDKYTNRYSEPTSMTSASRLVRRVNDPPDKTTINWYRSLREEERWLSLRDNLDQEQVSAFVKWINDSFAHSSNQLYSRLRVQNLVEELGDGLCLIYLIECLYEVTLVKETTKKSRLHIVKNFETCIVYMKRQRGANCVANAFDLADKKTSVLLGFLFLVKHDYEYNFKKIKHPVVFKPQSIRCVNRLSVRSVTSRDSVATLTSVTNESNLVPQKSVLQVSSQHQVSRVENLKDSVQDNLVTVSDHKENEKSLEISSVKLVPIIERVEIVQQIKDEPINGNGYYFQDIKDESAFLVKVKADQDIKIEKARSSYHQETIQDNENDQESVVTVDSSFDQDEQIVPSSISESADTDDASDSLEESEPVSDDFSIVDSINSLSSRADNFHQVPVYEFEHQVVEEKIPESLHTVEQVSSEENSLSESKYYESESIDEVESLTEPTTPVHSASTNTPHVPSLSTSITVIAAEASISETKPKLNVQTAKQNSEAPVYQEQVTKIGGEFKLINVDKVTIVPELNLPVASSVTVRVIEPEKSLKTESSSIKAALIPNKSAKQPISSLKSTPQVKSRQETPTSPVDLASEPLKPKSQNEVPSALNETKTQKVTSNLINDLPKEQKENQLPVIKPVQAIEQVEKLKVNGSVANGSVVAKENGNIPTRKPSLVESSVKETEVQTSSTLVVQSSTPSSNLPVKKEVLAKPESKKRVKESKVEEKPKIDDKIDNPIIKAIEEPEQSLPQLHSEKKTVSREIKSKVAQNGSGHLAKKEEQAHVNGVNKSNGTSEQQKQLTTKPNGIVKKSSTAQQSIRKSTGRPSVVLLVFLAVATLIALFLVYYCSTSTDVTFSISSFLDLMNGVFN